LPYFILDIKVYESELLEFLSYARQRIAVQALSPHGLTLRRFYRQVKEREEVDKEVLELRKQVRSGMGWVETKR
jgi:hypothetical protein